METHELCYGEFTVDCEAHRLHQHGDTDRHNAILTLAFFDYSRGGKAIRLTYDHKGSDAQEAKRITDAGGFVMNHRVNGVLAVTRSLGDTAMKEFVVGSPYTTETVLGSDDTFLIIACDGVSLLNNPTHQLYCGQD